MEIVPGVKILQGGSDKNGPSFPGELTAEALPNPEWRSWNFTHRGIPFFRNVPGVISVQGIADGSIARVTSTGFVVFGSPNGGSYPMSAAYRLGEVDNIRLAFIVSRNLALTCSVSGDISVHKRGNGERSFIATTVGNHQDCNLLRLNVAGNLILSRGRGGINVWQPLEEGQDWKLRHTIVDGQIWGSRVHVHDETVIIGLNTRISALNFSKPGAPIDAIVYNDPTKDSTVNCLALTPHGHVVAAFGEYATQNEPAINRLIRVFRPQVFVNGQEVWETEEISIPNELSNKPTTICALSDTEFFFGTEDQLLIAHDSDEQEDIEGQDSSHKKASYFVPPTLGHVVKAPNGEWQITAVRCESLLNSGVNADLMDELDYSRPTTLSALGNAGVWQTFFESSEVWRIVLKEAGPIESPAPLTPVASTDDEASSSKTLDEISIALNTGAHFRSFFEIVPRLCEICGGEFSESLKLRAQLLYIQLREATMTHEVDSLLRTCYQSQVVEISTGAGILQRMIQERDAYLD